MVSCHICIEQAKKPVSLPCGHIFCTDCIVQAIRAVKHFTNFHPCPVCRSVYNIAPANLTMVPPNLRLFVTPSIRRLYIDSPSPIDQEVNDTLIASTSSEISRLQAENHALRNRCVMWQRRAEMQGSQNISLIKLAYAIRYQASQFSRERDELERRFSSLKRKLDDDESCSRENDTAYTCDNYSMEIEPLEAPPPLLSSFSMSPTLNTRHTLPRHPADVAFSPRKRLRIDLLSPRTQAIRCARIAAERIYIRQVEAMNSMI